MKTIKKKMTLTPEEQIAVINGQSGTQTPTYSKAVLFFYEQINLFERTGKAIDYSFENGKMKTAMWFDQKSMAILMQFSYQQIEIDMREIEKEMIEEIEQSWQERKNKRG